MKGVAGRSSNSVHLSCKDNICARVERLMKTIATYCNILQHYATRWNKMTKSCIVATRCSMLLQHLMDHLMETKWYDSMKQVSPELKGTNGHSFSRRVFVLAGITFAQSAKIGVGFTNVYTYSNHLIYRNISQHITIYHSDIFWYILIIYIYKR